MYIYTATATYISIVISDYSPGVRSRCFTRSPSAQAIPSNHRSRGFRPLGCDMASHTCADLNAC